MKYWGVIAACLLFLSGSAQAAIIAMGDFTTDTDTGLDWLDHTLSVGMSFNQVTAELGSGGLFEGWSVATKDQAHTYLANAGWIGLFDSNNTSNINFVSNFEILTTDSLTNDPLDDIGMDRLIDDPISGIGELSFLDDPIGDMGGNRVTTYNFTNLVDPSIADSKTSTFLFRASAVPLPATCWLFISGLVFLISIVKSKSNHR